MVTRIEEAHRRAVLELRRDLVGKLKVSELEAVVAPLVRTLELGRREHVAELEAAYAENHRQAAAIQALQVRLAMADRRKN